MGAKSRYSFTTWFHLIFGTLICIVIIVFSTKIDLLKNSAKIPLPNIIPLSILFALGIYLIHAILKYAVVIQVAQKRISLKYIFRKSEEISDDDIKNVILFKRGYFNKMETILTFIELKNGRIISIPDEAYKNAYRLRQSIFNNFKEKVSDYPINQELKTPTTIIPDESYKFSGNPLFNFNTLLFLGLTLFLIFFFTNDLSLYSFKIFILIPVLFVFYLIFGHQLHFFIIKNETLLIRNHFFPWVNKVFCIKNIISINVEHIPKRSTLLRITTSDLKSKTYSAGSLSEEQWQLLITTLKEFGVTFLK